MAASSVLGQVSRNELERQWDELMLTGTHVGYIDGERRPASPVAVPIADSHGMPELTSFTQHGIFVKDLRERRWGLWVRGGWILKGGLLGRIDLGLSGIELYGKKVSRQEPFFILSVPFILHKDLDQLVAYNFYLLRRTRGEPRAVIVKQWMVPLESVAFRAPDSAPDVHAYLDYNPATSKVTVRLTGIKQPVEESMDLSARR